MDVPGCARPLLYTDCVVNIAPDLMAKRDIAQNAIELAHAIGIARPRSQAPIARAWCSGCACRWSSRAERTRCRRASRPARWPRSRRAIEMS
jgi:hypothetical protein